MACLAVFPPALRGASGDSIFKWNHRLLFVVCPIHFELAVDQAAVEARLPMHRAVVVVARPGADFDSAFARSLQLLFAVFEAELNRAIAASARTRLGFGIQKCGNPPRTQVHALARFHVFSIGVATAGNEQWKQHTNKDESGLE